MAKLQIPIDDSLMLKAKMFALGNGKTLKDLVLTAIENAISDTSNTNTTSTTSANSITESDPEILNLLRDTQKAIHDPETNYITIYPKIKHIEVDQAHIENEVVFGNDYILAPEEGYDQSLTRDDVDPLYILPEEEWKAKLEEARRLRG